MEFLFPSTRYLTRSLFSLVTYPIEHSKRNSISTLARVSSSMHLLVSMFFIFHVAELFFDTLGCLEKESSRSMSSKLRTLYPSMMPCKYASSTRKVRVPDVFFSCTNKNYKADFAYPIVGLLAERGKLPALSQRF